MATMILQMTASTGLYLIITILLWTCWSRYSHTWQMKAAIGIIYGICSIASTHLGVDYRDMILNVRDLGPLAAGLFFDPVSGIISGVIGGVERYIAGAYWGIGAYTKVACSLSTFLAGILSALLNKYLYKGKRPPASQSFFIGALMEVFHMYAVFLTHRDDMNMAYYVVRTCSIPMIIFSGVGLFCCSVFIMFLSGGHTDRIPIRDLERTPIATRFYRRLLTVIMIIFITNHIMDYNFQVRNAYQEAEDYLEDMGEDLRKLYFDSGRDLDKTKEHMRYAGLTNSDSVLYIIFDDDRKVLSSMYDAGADETSLEEDEYKKLVGQIGGSVFRYKLNYYGGADTVCHTIVLDDHLYLTLAWWYSTMMRNQSNQAYELLLSDILLFTVLYLLIAVLVETLVCRNLKSVNDSLQKIIGGDLNEVVSVRDSAEFSLLSDDINKTVATLKGYIDESERRMEEELNLAAIIQESALPHIFTYSRNDFEIYALMKPARQIGGDFYDFFFTDINKMALVIADVSGKGIPAALFMMRSKTAIANAARQGKSPAETLYEVNNILCEGNDAEMFVTAWIGIIDLETGLMHCANAGHEYPVLCRAGGEYQLIKDKHALVLAAMENVPMKEYTLQMEPGDRLFVYTDGVPEAINKNKEAYGTERLADWLNTLRTEPQEWTLKSVYKNIVEFVGEEEQFDDITMLGFTYNGGEETNRNGRNV